MKITLISNNWKHNEEVAFTLEKYCLSFNKPRILNTSLIPSWKCRKVLMSRICNTVIAIILIGKCNQSGK